MRAPLNPRFCWATAFAHRVQTNKEAKQLSTSSTSSSLAISTFGAWDTQFAVGVRARSHTRSFLHISFFRFISNWCILFRWTVSFSIPYCYSKRACSCSWYHSSKRIVLAEHGKLFWKSIYRLYTVAICSAVVSEFKTITIDVNYRRALRYAKRFQWHKRRTFIFNHNIIASEKCREMHRHECARLNRTEKRI